MIMIFLSMEKMCIQVVFATLSVAWMNAWEWPKKRQQTNKTIKNKNPTHWKLKCRALHWPNLHIFTLAACCLPHCLFQIENKAQTLKCACGSLEGITYVRTPSINAQCRSMPIKIMALIPMSINSDWEAFRINAMILIGIGHWSGESCYVKETISGIQTPCDPLIFDWNNLQEFGVSFT